MSKSKPKLSKSRSPYFVHLMRNPQVNICIQREWMSVILEDVGGGPGREEEYMEWKCVGGLKSGWKIGFRKIQTPS